MNKKNLMACLFCLVILVIGMIFTVKTDAQTQATKTHLTTQN